MFASDGLPEPDWAAVEAALGRAGEERIEDLRRSGTPLPGVREILKAVSTQGGWVSSVLTGNIAAIAM
ncbi:hypothetical protein [Streptomyces scopuliridis]|uniref:hypothetical protein n=1 Tax=Streptomyces scopuliridis TaxID=452529 RepID=UPI0036D13C74